METCKNCSGEFEPRVSKSIWHEYCRRCAKKFSLGIEQSFDDLPLILGVFLDRSSKKAFGENDRFLLGKKTKFDTICVNCGKKYSAALVFERTKKHSWHCKSCAVTIEWKNEKYRTVHEKALKIAHNRPDAKLAHSRAQIQKWKDPDEREKMEAALQAAKTPEWREKVSKSLRKRWASDNPPNNSFGTRAAGWHTRPDGSKCYLRSSYEHRVARVFDEQGIEWVYEKRRFPIIVEQKSTTYIPDFYLPNWDLIIEVKGYFYPDARKKWDAFREQYKGIKSCLWFEEQVKMLEEGELNIANQVKNIHR